MSSVALGLGGAALGWSLSKISGLENVRGGIAGWSLLGFGFIYSVWGLIKANRTHKHFDIYEDGSIYVYQHKHGEVVQQKERHAVTPWVMFLIFVLGPCEPMIPLLYFPAVRTSLSSMIILILVYTFFTLATMLVMVLLGYYSIRFFRTKKLEKYMHALAGFTLLTCGLGMVIMDW